MSDDAKRYRAEMKAKARRMANGSNSGDIDASGWREPTDMHADVKTGERPVTAAPKPETPVSGMAGPRNAGRAARASGGKAIMNDYINRNVRTANEERDGIKHQGGFKRGGKADGGVPTTRFNFAPTQPGLAARGVGLASGGRAHPDAAEDKKLIDSAIAKHAKGCRCSKCMGGVARASGGRTNAEITGMRPTGGRDARASGGGNWIAGATKNKGALHRELHVPEGERIPAKKLAKAEHSSNPTERKRANLAKKLKGLHKADGGAAFKRGGRANGKMNVNIVIAPGGRDQPPPSAAPPVAGPPPMMPPPMRPPTPPMPPPGMPMGAGPPPGMPMPPGGPPPMLPRRRGGRAQPAGAGSGLGRLEKIAEYGKNA